MLQVIQQPQDLIASIAQKYFGHVILYFPQEFEPQHFFHNFMNANPNIQFEHPELFETDDFLLHQLELAKQSFLASPEILSQPVFFCQFCKRFMIPAEVSHHCRIPHHIAAKDNNDNLPAYGCPITLHGRPMVLDCHVIFPHTMFGPGVIMYDDTIGAVVLPDASKAVQLCPGHEYSLVRFQIQVKKASNTGVMRDPRLPNANRQNKYFTKDFSATMSRNNNQDPPQSGITIENNNNSGNSKNLKQDAAVLNDDEDGRSSSSSSSSSDDDESDNTSTTKEQQDQDDDTVSVTTSSSAIPNTSKKSYQRTMTKKQKDNSNSKQFRSIKHLAKSVLELDLGEDFPDSLNAAATRKVARFRKQVELLKVQDAKNRAGKRRDDRDNTILRFPKSSSNNSVVGRVAGVGALFSVDDQMEVVDSKTERARIKLVKNLAKEALTGFEQVDWKKKLKRMRKKMKLMALRKKKQEKAKENEKKGKKEKKNKV